MRPVAPEPWQVIERMVRKAAWEESKLPKPPPMSVSRPSWPGASTTRLWGLDQEIYSSVSERGRRLRPIEPNPFHVVVITECCLGPLSAGGFTADDEHGHKFMSRVAARLRKDPWVTDAGWESYDAATAYFWVTPLMAA